MKIDILSSRQPCPVPWYDLPFYAGVKWTNEAQSVKQKESWSQRFHLLFLSECFLGAESGSGSLFQFADEVCFEHFSSHFELRCLFMPWSLGISACRQPWLGQVKLQHWKSSNRKGEVMVDPGFLGSIPRFCKEFVFRNTFICFKAFRFIKETLLWSHRRLSCDLIGDSPMIS